MVTVLSLPMPLRSTLQEDHGSLKATSEPMLEAKDSELLAALRKTALVSGKPFCPDPCCAVLTDSAGGSLLPQGYIRSYVRSKGQPTPGSPAQDSPGSGKPFVPTHAVLC